MNHPNMTRLKAEVETQMTSFLRKWPADSDGGLYDPIHYLMSLGGKRLRAILALSVSEAEGGQLKEAIPVALAVELFHNFTLMHDDIMDEAPMRRGHPTVHTRWNSNAAILSGDAMYTMAGMAMAETSPQALPAALKLFNQTALEVCIGQQSDMAFELRSEVSLSEYMEMIRLKTSVLVAASMSLGALASGMSDERVKLWYAFGEKLGMAFQMQDDLLDAFGNEETGKQVGGDILSDKKTFLRIYSWAHANQDQRDRIGNWDGRSDDPKRKIKDVTEVMLEVKADVAARRHMQEFTDDALKYLDALSLEESHRKWMSYLVGLVSARNN